MFYWVRVVPLQYVVQEKHSAASRSKVAKGDMVSTHELAG